MKLVLGSLLLLALFALASVWQRNWMREVRAEREQLRGDTAADAIDARPDWARPDWGRVIIGRPSGAEPVESVRRDALVAPNPTSRPASDALKSSSPPASETAKPPVQEREFKLVVQHGQSLSTICQSHYKSGRHELIEALARYNKLADVNALKEGQTLSLPPIEKLLLDKKP